MGGLGPAKAKNFLVPYKAENSNIGYRERGHIWSNECS